MDKMKITAILCLQRLPSTSKQVGAMLTLGCVLGIVLSLLLSKKYLQSGLGGNKQAIIMHLKVLFIS